MRYHKLIYIYVNEENLYMEKAHCDIMLYSGRLLGAEKFDKCILKVYE